MRKVLMIGSEILSPFQRTLEEDGYEVVLRTPGESPSERLYELPDEGADLAARDPGARVALGIELDARLGLLPVAFAPERQTLSADDRDALRSLGYLD